MIMTVERLSWMHAQALRDIARDYNQHAVRCLEVQHLARMLLDMPAVAKLPPWADDLRERWEAMEKSAKAGHAAVCNSVHLLHQAIAQIDPPTPPQVM